jgi:hypothetical protein
MKEDYVNLSPQWRTPDFRVVHDFMPGDLVLAKVQTRTYVVLIMSKMSNMSNTYLALYLESAIPDLLNLVTTFSVFGTMTTKLLSRSPVA